MDGGSSASRAYGFVIGLCPIPDYPVLVGGGISFFPQRERRVDLELVETRTFSSKFVYLRYRVAR